MIQSAVRLSATRWKLSEGHAEFEYDPTTPTSAAATGTCTSRTFLKNNNNKWDNWKPKKDQTFQSGPKVSNSHRSLGPKARREDELKNECCVQTTVLHVLERHDPNHATQPQSRPHRQEPLRIASTLTPFFFGVVRQNPYQNIDVRHGICRRPIRAISFTKN